MRIVSSSFVTTKTSFSRKKVRIIKEMQQGNLKNLKEGTPVGLGKVIKNLRAPLTFPFHGQYTLERSIARILSRLLESNLGDFLEN